MSEVAEYAQFTGEETEAQSTHGEDVEKPRSKPRLCLEGVPRTESEEEGRGR